VDGTVSKTRLIVGSAISGASSSNYITTGSDDYETLMKLWLEEVN
jgi:hypothetical protein